MKNLLWFLAYLLIATIVLLVWIKFLPSWVQAGGHEYDKPSKSAPKEVPKPVTPSMPTPPQTPPVASPSVPSAPSGGGIMIPCSGPLSVGWRVDQPNGGCTPKPVAPITSIKLSSLPATGLQLNFFEYLWYLLTGK